MTDEEHTELHRRIRWRLSIAEQALDLAVGALSRARHMAAIDAAMAEEFGQDIALLRGKLDSLAALLA